MVVAWSLDPDIGAKFKCIYWTWQSGSIVALPEFLGVCQIAAVTVDLGAYPPQHRIIPCLSAAYLKENIDQGVAVLIRTIGNVSPSYNNIHVALDPSWTVLLCYSSGNDSCAWSADPCQNECYFLANKEHATASRICIGEVDGQSDAYRKRSKC